MIGNKNTFLSALAFAMAGCICAPASWAADDVVLFKIHDVTPVENADGLTASCKYGITFYNRSSYTLKNARLSLSWQDEGISKVIEEEKQDTKNNRNSRSKKSETEAVTPNTVVSAITISNLGPKQQKSFQQTLNSDRCFLLMGNVNFTAGDCSVASSGENSENPYSGDQCSSFFQFVSPENPEYYRDFGPISYTQEKTNAAEERTKDRSEINKLYEETLSEFNKVKSTLAEIKGNVNPDDIAPASLSDNGVVVGGAENADSNLSAKLDTLLPALNNQGNPVAGQASQDSSLKQPSNNATSGAAPSSLDTLLPALNNQGNPVAGQASQDSSLKQPSNNATSGAAPSSPNGPVNLLGALQQSNNASSANSANSGMSSGAKAPSANGSADISVYVKGIIGNGVFNDDVVIDVENQGYEGRTFERPASGEKPAAETTSKMEYNSPNAI